MDSAPTWYLNWDFWTALVAALALVLSQLPPLHRLLRGPRITVEAHRRLLLAHKVGNPNAQIHLILGNLGGRSARIHRIELAFTRDGEKVGTLFGDGYLTAPAAGSPRLLTSFSLAPGEDWAYFVNFMREVSRQEVKEYRDAELTLKASIFEQRKADTEPKQLYEAKPSTVVPFEKMFEQRFVWKPGEYQLAIAVHAKPESAGATRRYRFTVFESESLELRQAADDFRFGDGIYWDSGKHTGVVVQLAEI